MHTPIVFRQRRDLGDVLNDTFGFIRQNAVPLGKSLLYLVAPASLLFSVCYALFYGRFLAFTRAVGEGDPEALTVMTEAAGMGVVSLLMGLTGLVALVLEVVVVYGYTILYQERGGAGIGVEDVRGFVKRHFWTTVGAVLFFGIVYGIFVLLVFTALGVVLAVLVPSNTGAIVVFVLVSYLVAFVAVLYGFVVVSIALPALLQERRGIVAAFGRAFQLLRGAFWSTFLVLLVTWLLVSVLGFLFSLPAMVVVFLSTMHGVEGSTGGPSGVLLTVALTVSGVGSLLLYPIPLLASSFQYFTLVERMEGVGLMQRIDALQDPAAPAPGAAPPGYDEGYDGRPEEPRP